MQTSNNPKKRATKIGCPKDVRKLIDIAQRHQWKVESTNGQHIRFVPPKKDRPIIIHSLSASDWRAIANLKSRLRRSGLDV